MAPNFSASRAGRVNPALLRFFGGLLIVVIATSGLAWLRSSKTHRITPSATPSLPNTGGDPKRAQVIREFHDTHGEKVLNRVEQDAKRDPAYGSALLRITKEHIWSKKNLSEEEKQEMWERTQRIQRRLRSTNQ